MIQDDNKMLKKREGYKAIIKPDFSEIDYFINESGDRYIVSSKVKYDAFGEYYYIEEISNVRTILKPIRKLSGKFFNYKEKQNWLF